jgi:hypothetical protein
MPKQPRNRREKWEQGKESSTEEEGSKKLATRPHEQPPDAPGTPGETRGRVCPLREILIDGDMKVAADNQIMKDWRINFGIHPPKEKNASGPAH